MANRHVAQKKSGGGIGGAEKVYGNTDVISSAKKGNKPGAITKEVGGVVGKKAAGGRLDKRARGGNVSKSPFSSAHQKGG